MWNGFKGRAKRLDDIDLPAIGHRIGVGEDEIHAVLEVESRGSGFDKQGRPAMLFEPHIFWDELKDADQRKEAARLGIAYPNWGARPYPKDSYDRLRMAMNINDVAALRSASWGLGQVMGFNFKAAGYPSVQAMVRAFMDDEEAQLSGMINFIRTNRLDDEIRRHDWTAFARGYNGPGFAKHNYDGRLAAAYAKWKRIPNTPWTPGQSALETAMNDPVSGGVNFPAKTEIYAAEGAIRVSGDEALASSIGRSDLPPSDPTGRKATAPTPGFWSRLWATLFGSKA